MLNSVASYFVVAWGVVAVGVFPSFSHPRRAVLAVVLFGTLFLPEALPAVVKLGPVRLDKYHAISYAALVGALLFDAERLFAQRPRLIDAPALAWCLCPFVSVLTNDPPPDGSPALRDALSQTWSQTVSYGVPYLLGRVYFADSPALRELAIGIIVAAVVYVPLCLFEARFSPQSHQFVYGYAQHSFAQTVRFGGYRPMVFLPHGLALAMFMASAAVIACWTWWCGGFARTDTGEGATPGAVRYSPPLLSVTAVLLKSTGALGLSLCGVAVLLLARGLRSKWPVLVLAAVPVAYVSVRATGEWSGDSLVGFVSDQIDAERAQSLEFRLQNENILVKKANERLAFGWGGWGRNRVFDEDTGADVSVTDGFWIIVLGDRGLLGLCALGGVILIPVVRYATTTAPAEWSTPAGAPVAACVVVLVLWCVDSLFNAFPLPIYFVIAGGLAGLTTEHKAAVPAARHV